MGDDDSSTKKYHQIVVPDHELKSGKSGTSFLRTGTFPSLTDPTKQPPGFRKSLELAHLAGDHHLKTGGSWHHIDGNRVETTTGRKVEVIAGSYVAHRGPGNSPGPNFSATWATSSYTEVGSKDTPVGWTPGAAAGSPSTSPGTPANDPGDNWVESLSYAYDFPSAPAAGTDTNPSVVEVTSPGSPLIPQNFSSISNNSLQNGDVVTVTWANRILTYQGSASQPVGLVFAETQAGTIKQRNFAQTGDIVSWNHAPGGKFWQDALATTILTTSEAKADITVTNTAPFLFTANTAVAINTANLGAGEIGTFNAAVELLTLNLGNQTTLNFPIDTTISDLTTRVKNSEDDITLLMLATVLNKLNISAVESDITTMKSNIGAMKTDIADAHTRITKIHQHMGLTGLWLELQHILGV